ncbi:MAG: ankyrin repeat domain-containing protein [Azonexus sp.]|nr:ankyrin repeat domain-containing protein [Azonexus sp.]MBP6204162.1 ankyrin repeat domain-containing protein [Azonexus sp.]
MTAKGFTSNNLLDAIRAGSLSGVISALDNGDDIELPDVHGCRGLPLRTACFEGNLAIVRELLNHGANPNAVASDGAGAPLRLALRKGHQNIVDLLLESGATPNAGTATPLDSLEGPAPHLPDEAIVTPSQAHDPGNIIEYSSSSLPLPSSEASEPSLTEDLTDNTIDFSYADNHLPFDDAEAPTDFGSATNVLSMDLLFLDENETPELSLRPADKQVPSAAQTVPDSKKEASVGGGPP